MAVMAKKTREQKLIEERNAVLLMLPTIRCVMWPRERDGVQCSDCHKWRRQVSPETTPEGFIECRKKNTRHE